jgi:hypothetical protein
MVSSLKEFSVNIGHHPANVIHHAGATAHTGIAVPDADRRIEFNNVCSWQPGLVCSLALAFVEGLQLKLVR